jgi:hypothetical protein
MENEKYNKLKNAEEAKKFVSEELLEKLNTRKDFGDR